MLGVALSACSTPAPAALPDGVQVSLVQLRGDIAPGRVQLHIENASDRTVTISAATLSSSVLTETASWEPRRAETLTTGRSVNLPIILPPVACSDESSAATASLTIDDADGARTASASVPDELAVLSRLAATECDREAVESVARVEVASVEPGDDAARVRLSITPTGDRAAAVTLVAVRGTPLLRFATGEEAPLGVEVAADDPASTATVDVVPRRCDPHAIAEDKVGTRLQLVADVDGREVVYPLPRADAITGDLLAYAAAACGLTP